MVAGRNERRVRARRVVVFSVFAALGFALVAFGVVSAIPRGVATVTGVAVESTRDIGRTPKAPIEYVFQGETRTEMVSHVEVVSGDEVTFEVNSDGFPDGGSWLLAGFLLVVGSAAVGLGLFAGWIFSVDGYEDRLYFAQAQDRAESRALEFDSAL